MPDELTVVICSKIKLCVTSLDEDSEDNEDVSDRDAECSLSASKESARMLTGCRFPEDCLGTGKVILFAVNMPTSALSVQCMANETLMEQM